MRGGELKRVGKVSEVPEGAVRGFEVDGRIIAVANLGESGFRAINDVCTHAEALLHEGEVDVDDETIECPRHGSTFDLNTGRPTALPATIPEDVYAVKTEGEDILIEVDE